jgi:hypothetical protein
MQKDLWGNPVVRRTSYWVFHDESIPNKRWLLIGLLFVRPEHLEEARRFLYTCRDQENYYGEIHFSDLPKRFEGRYGARARVARRWLQGYEQGLSEIARFTALAVERHSPAFEHKRFAQEYHTYNRFTAMALKAGISWFLGQEGWDSVTITLVSDAKRRMRRPEQGWIDNFEKYLPYRAKLDAFLSREEGKPYPRVSLQLQLQDSSACDLLQLCDVLLGATQMALVAGSHQPTKRELGAMVVRWCRDLQQPRRKQQFGLCRRFDLWGFPDKNGAAYSPVPLQLQVDMNHPTLF